MINNNNCFYFLRTYILYSLATKTIYYNVRFDWIETGRRVLKTIANRYTREHNTQTVYIYIYMYYLLYNNIMYLRLWSSFELSSTKLRFKSNPVTRTTTYITRRPYMSCTRTSINIKCTFIVQVLLRLVVAKKNTFYE